MLEDVLGWLVVLIGAVVMRFTDLAILDPALSIGVALFVLISAVGNLKEAVDLFLEKTPRGIDVEELCHHVREVDGVADVHHVHVWSLDGQNNYATMHIVFATDAHAVKERVRAELAEHGIAHVTLELEAEGEPCCAVTCHVEHAASGGHHHHHH